MPQCASTAPLPTTTNCRRPGPVRSRQAFVELDADGKGLQTLPFADACEKVLPIFDHIVRGITGRDTSSQLYAPT